MAWSADMNAGFLLAAAAAGGEAAACEAVAPPQREALQAELSHYRQASPTQRRALLRRWSQALRPSTEPPAGAVPRPRAETLGEEGHDAGRLSSIERCRLAQARMQAATDTTEARVAQERRDLEGCGWRA